MATKTIKFRQNTDGATSIADGADGVLLATASTGGVYPQSISGQTIGWVSNASGVNASAPFGAASPFQYSQISVPTGTGTVTTLQIGCTAGVTYTVKVQSYLPDPTYSRVGVVIYNSDGTTALFTQTAADRISDTLGNKQTITDGTMVAVGTSDPGVTITPSGTSFFITLPVPSAWNTRVAYIEYTAAGGGGGTAALFRRRYS